MRGFDDFDGSGGEIVFWAQGDDRAASVQSVANQLEGSGAHGYLGSMRKAILKTLSPRRSASEIINVRTRSIRNARRLVPELLFRLGGRSSERTNQGAQRSGRRRLNIFLIGAEHAFENVSTAARTTSASCRPCRPIWGDRMSSSSCAISLS